MDSNHSREEAPVTVQSLFDAAFAGAREPRSEAYRHGVLAALTFRIENRRLVCPYAIGTAERDAYVAGCDEGNILHTKAKGGRYGDR